MDRGTRVSFWIGLGIGALVATVNALIIGVLAGYHIGYRIAAKDKWEAERHDEILERLDSETEWEIDEDAA